MTPLNEVWKLFEHRKNTGIQTGKKKKIYIYKDTVQSKQTAGRNQANPHMLPIW